MSSLVDSGPLVALLNKRDTHHTRAVSMFERASKPWLVCEAVISETLFILRRVTSHPDGLLALLERSAVTVGYSARGDENELARLLRKYANVPMSVADACLVRMSEQSPRSLLLTFDDDFSVYRRADRRIVPLLK